MNFTRFLDIQSWWEVPSIAYFCSLFRTAFNLLDFDIEELEEALLTDGTEDSGSSLLTELIVRLLNGCLGNNDISAFNYQMYLRRLFRQKCQESGRYNPFNTDIDFQFLPLRRKVEILYALCDFRLDAEDVFDLFKNLEAESLRVEPLGWDDNDSAYWYFYGTRLYIEDIIRKPKGKKKKKSKNKKRGWLHGSEWNEDETERVWQVVCFTEEDWTNLTQKFSKATSKVEKELYRSLSQNFMPEIPRLFHEKERLQRKRLLELAPRRTSSRVLQKMRQEEENRKVTADVFKVSDSKESQTLARNNRANHRNFERAKPASSDSDSSEAEEMPKAKIPKQGKKKTPPTSAQNGEKIPIRNVRKTNNSLASATFQSDQIVIPENDEPVNSTRKKLKTSQIFNQTDEDIRTDMYKVLEQLTNHQDAWPFLDPVEEDYAPNYYSVIRRPMDLHTMEQRLDNGYYPDFATFKADFTLIVNNCRLYNGQDNEYTTMVDNLQVEFDRLTEKYMYHMSSSDEEIAVEYQLPTPTRRQKRKVSASPTPTQGKLKIQKTQIDDEVPKCSTSFEELINEDGNTTNDVTKASDEVEQDLNNGDQVEKEDSKACKKAHEKGKKRHRHGRHSKVHKKKLHGSKSKHSKKHSKRTGVDKKLKHKHKRTKRVEAEPSEPEPQMKRRESQESMTSSNNRSASPLPSIHTPSPSPTQVDKMESDGEANETTQNDPATYNAKSVSTVNCKVAEFTSRSSMERVWKSVLVNDIREKTLKNLNKKEKNQTLRETIEKLKTKNKKYRDPSLFTSLFTPRSGRRVEKKPYYKEDSEDDFSDDEALESVKAKCNNKKITKKNSTKTKSTSEALEEAVKDISKWLDEIPETSIVSPLSNSPAPTVSTEEQDSSSRQDDEVSVGEKTVPNRKDFTRKRPSSREPKLVKRREIQRTIDRLQPGKSKGNLLTNVPKSSDRVDDNSSSGYINSGDSNQTEEAGPKLNLGSVLPTVNFALQLTQDFNKDVLTEEKTTMVTKVTESESAGLATEKEEPPEVVVLTAKKDVEKENKAVVFSKPNQEKVTPNLSAWFKAFGAPKATGPVNCTKKKMKDAENEEKPAESESAEVKASPKLNSNKVESPNNPNSPNHDGGDSSRTSSDTLVLTTQWPRRTSTGSSISEQSSFSQDLDSPRQLISHTSPLLRSPASPRSYDDYQKSYSAINGTVRAGFYQDTTSVKSSPDKICSPREAPHSPYSPCPQHVYSASATQRAATPNYFVDPNKSPLLTNSQTTSLYYEANKTSVPNKTPKPNDNLSLVSPSLYSPTQTNYTQNSSHLPLNSAQAQSNLVNETKTTFPMKKRMYNELEQPQAAEPPSQQQQTAPCAKLVNKIITQTPAINSIKQYHTALTEKCHLANREPKYTEHINDVYENVEQAHARKNPDVTEAFEIAMKNEAGMVNVNYFVSDESRQNNVTPDVEYFGREAKSSVSKTPRRYEIDSMSMESQQLPKPLSKPDIGSYNFIPAHSHERHNDMNMNKQTIAHAHQTPYDSLNQQIGGLCFNDIELANKKLYTNNISRTPLDYANWKATNQMRPQEHLPIDFSYINSNDKSLQQQQYYNYAVPRITSHKNQIINQIPSSELKIPNPRGMKSDVQSTLTKIPQDNPFMSSLSYKSPYTSHSTLLDSIKPMRNVNDNELYLSSFTNALYPTKQLEMAQVFGNTPGSSSIIYTQARNFIECDIKRIQKRLRKTMESKQTASSQAYAASSSGNNALRSEKRSSLLRPTLCEFGSTNMNIDGMYANDPIYNIGNIRNSTDQVMAANYMAEAVASQRNNGASAEKFLQPANQSSHSGSFPFIAHSQLGAGYPYVNTEASSPLYQQYVQHYQDMQRQTGAQIMGLYPPTYPPTLSVRQPYDSTDPSSSK